MGWETRSHGTRPLIVRQISALSFHDQSVCRGEREGTDPITYIPAKLQCREIQLERNVLLVRVN